MPRLSSIQISARDTCPYFRPRATESRVWSHTRENLSNLFDKFIHYWLCSCHEFLESDRVNRTVYYPHFFEIFSLD